MKAADMILGCFGLTLDDVFAQFGKPSQTSEIKLSLYDILAALLPEMIDDEIRNGHATLAA